MQYASAIRAGSDMSIAAVRLSGDAGASPPPSGGVTDIATSKYLSLVDRGLLAGRTWRHDADDLGALV